MLLGNDALYRLLLDAAIMRDYRCLWLTANPILMTRRLFDREYDYRVADWGGGYPRPFQEIIHHKWRAANYTPDAIIISEDPHLSKKALKEAQQVKTRI